MANLYWPRRGHFRSRTKKQARKERGWAQAEADAKNVLVISHGYCMDGVASAVVALRTLGPAGVGVAYAQPNQMQEALTFFSKFPARGRRLLIADLSLNAPQFPAIVAAVRTLREAGWTIEWRDHHHKQWEGIDLPQLEQHLAVLTVNDDGTESGASLMQQALAPDDDFLRRFAAVVRDRDCWLNQDPDSEVLEYAMTRLGAHGFRDHFVAAPADGKVVDDTIRAAADAQRAEQDAQGERLLESARTYRADNGRSVAIVYGWLPKNVGLHQLLEDGCDMAVNVRPNAKMSIRSAKGADVSHLVARDFRGGGHPNASGGDLQLEGAAFWWYVLRRGKVARVAQVRDAALRELSALPARDGNAPSGGA